MQKSPLPTPLPPGMRPPSARSGLATRLSSALLPPGLPHQARQRRQHQLVFIPPCLLRAACPCACACASALAGVAPPGASVWHPHFQLRADVRAYSSGPPSSSQLPERTPRECRCAFRFRHEVPRAGVGDHVPALGPVLPFSLTF
jgi:hypothetical protein